ncbi:alkaline phosphatase [Candidatus Bathyarchaeota archaeon]|nr:alkaline phosphatase [Candidatus Bathyarchaeota archaeon]
MKNNVKKILVVVFILGIIVSTASLSQARREVSPYDNVIVLVPDGCNQNIQTLARWYSDEPLVLDSMVSGSVSTYMANSIITGSAAAATAFATGHKTSVRFLGVGPRTDDLLTGFEPTAAPYAPIASVLEGSKLNGKAVGLIATSRISHATPAAYACHIDDRGKDNDIMENMVYEDIDVVFGGGFRHLINDTDSYTTTFGDTWGGKRTDGQNLYQVLLDRGYSFVDNEDDMDSLTSGPVWGMFDDSHMDPEMDRETLHPTQPSLADMTAKAIQLLSKDPEGFFLMVEGSQIDWAGHANDGAYMVTDFIEFDEAVKVAVNFAKSDKRTLVLVFPDHNTGGMTLGNYGPGGAYTHVTYEELVEPLKGMTMSSGALAGKVDSLTISGVKDAISEYWNINISNDSAQKILDLEAELGLSYAIAHIVSMEYTHIGWTTFGHNGGDVPLWSYSSHPGRGFSGVSGFYDNTELAYLAAEALDINLDSTTNELFVEVSEVLDDTQWTVEDSTGDNPEIVIQLADGNEARINAGSDVIRINGSTYTQLKGIVVYAPMTGQVWIPQDGWNYLEAYGFN